MSRPSIHWRVWLWLAVVSLGGGLLRLYRLGSVPPGLHYDEAVYGLQALDILNGLRTVFFASYTGREPLYMYLMAVVFRILGPGELGIRLTSALIGLATIPLVFLVMRELLIDRRSANRVGLLASAYVALSYWHLTVSRNGYPNILIPPLECLAIYFLWRGYREGHLLASLVGGAFTGLVLYTYLAARFFPVTLVLFAAYLLIVDWRRLWSHKGTRALGLLLAGFAALAVFTPLGLYFLKHPEHFWERANQVLVFRQAASLDAVRMLIRNMGLTLGGIVFRGDPRNHFNLPGKPVLSPIAAVLFAVGLLVTVRKWRRPEYALLPIWLVGMSLPAVLTSAQMPQGQRMFGIVPAVYGLVALGMDTIWRTLEGKAHRLGHVAVVLVLAGLVFEAGVTAKTYFQVWAQRRQTYYSTHADHNLLAERATRAIDEGHEVVILSREYKHPTIVLSDPRTLNATWISGGRTFVVPNRPGQEVLYLWPEQSRPLDPALNDTIERVAETLENIHGPEGETALRIMQPRESALSQALAAEAKASFAHEIEVLDWSLVGGDPDHSFARDMPIRALVTWRIRAPGQAVHLAMHLVDGKGVRWSQSDEMGYFGENWETGDTVFQIFKLELPEGIPAGDYELRLVMSTAEGGLVPVVEDGALSGVYLSLNTLTLKHSGRTLAALNASGPRFGAEFAVLHHDTLDRVEYLGSDVDLNVTWQSLQEPAENRDVAITLVSRAGDVALTHVAPLADQYPTSAWREGEVVRAIYRLPLRDLDPGIYTVYLGITALDGELNLGQIRVEGGTRSFEVPEIDHPLEARVGDEIALLGFDLADREYRPGGELALKLYWRAIITPAQDGKVFVHLVDSNGQIRAQHDAVPANWGRPTIGWAANEVIEDEHVLALGQDLPPGRYTLYIGLYDSESLQRLPILTAGGSQTADGRLQLTSVTVQP